MTDVLIASIAKNSRERIQVAVREYRGHQMIDVRVYASSGGGIVPTQKGVAIRPDLIEPIIEALRSAVATMDGERS